MKCSLGVLQPELEQMRAKCEEQHEGLVTRISTLERNASLLEKQNDLKMREILSPVTTRLFVCEQLLHEMKSTSATPTSPPHTVPSVSPSPTPRPIPPVRVSTTVPVTPVSSSPTPAPIPPISTSECPPAFNRQFKIIFLGDSDVGKTSIIGRCTKDEYVEDRGATVGVGFGAKYITMNNETIKLSIWDTAGQEKFRTLTRNYYRTVDGVILVYDIAKPRTLTNLVDIWLNELIDNNVIDVPLLIVGNNSHLRESRTPDSLVSTAQGEEVAKKHGALFAEVSPESFESIYEALHELVERLTEGTTPPQPRNVGVNLESRRAVRARWDCR
jgi:small GTP-binding protein